MARDRFLEHTNRRSGLSPFHSFLSPESTSLTLFLRPRSRFGCQRAAAAASERPPPTRRHKGRAEPIGFHSRSQARTPVPR